MVLLLGIVCLIMAEKYPAKYDQVNIDNVLSNDRVLTNYIKCLLEKGACTREGRELKSKLLYIVYLLPLMLQSLHCHFSTSVKRFGRVLITQKKKKKNTWKKREEGEKK